MSNKAGLIVTTAIRVLLTMVIVGGLLFGSAGTWQYWEAWVYCALFFIPMLIITTYFLLTDPSLIERRMGFGERDWRQNVVLGIISLLYFLIYLFAGLDHRYGWSDIPITLVIIADVIVLGSYMFATWVFLVNRYAASRLVVEAGQPVISTGPYALVRHPMYLGVLLMIIFTPLALGSYWTLLYTLPLPLLLASRIKGEEQILSRDLPGYDNYRRKVRWRLIPGVW